MTEKQRAGTGDADPLEKKITRKHSSTSTPIANQAVKAHFDRAVDLLEQRRAVLADIAEWRNQIDLIFALAPEAGATSSRNMASARATSTTLKS
jgi:hypothetical protein